MSDTTDGDNQPVPYQLGALGSLLGDPALWAEPSPGVEGDVLAAIASLASDSGLPSATSINPVPINPVPINPVPINPAPAGTGPAGTGPDNPEPTLLSARSRPYRQPEEISLDKSHRRRRRWILAPLAAAAAIAAAALATLAVVNNNTGTSSELVALNGTDLAPKATAEARIEEQPNGARIVLDLRDLPPAPPGTFYAAWVLRDEPKSRVAAGTFHMRGGDGTIELWAGVSTESYRTLSVTLQSEDDPAGPGQVVLRGRRS
jgi:hypothetical protein